MRTLAARLTVSRRNWEWRETAPKVRPLWLPGCRSRDTCVFTEGATLSGPLDIPKCGVTVPSVEFENLRQGGMEIRIQTESTRSHSTTLSHDRHSRRLSTRII